jgi:dipeptidyl aminopeptidase/acylaminoacyl peptidase
VTPRLPYRLTRSFAPLAALTLIALSAPLGRPLFAQDRPAPDAETLPLKTARTHTFTTTKGSWLSLDVSPDGSQIVFDLLGDLYTMPIAGGKATRLTSGMGFDAQPRFSPDGKKIVLARSENGDTDLFVVDAATGAVRTLAGSGNREVPRDGVAAQAMFLTPTGLAWTNATPAVLYVADDTAVRAVRAATRRI